MYDARKRCEDWFSRYKNTQSAHQAKELRSRFRTREAETHDGAFLELFVHELLCRMGYGVAAIPERSKDAIRTPDFCIEHRGRRFYVEVTHKGQAPNEQNTVHAFLDQLAKYKIHGWFATFTSRGTLERYLGTEKAIEVVNFAKSLPYPADKAMSRWNIDGPSKTVHDGKWRGEFTFHPLRNPDEGLDMFVGIRSTEEATIQIGDPDARYASQIRDMITDKSRRYDAEYTPLIVLCVDNTHELSWGFNEDKDSMILDGIWGSKSNPRNLAGVWMFRGVSSFYIKNNPAILYSNPHQDIPLPQETWTVSDVQEYMLTQREQDNLSNREYPLPTGPDVREEL